MIPAPALIVLLLTAPPSDGPVATAPEGPTPCPFELTLDTPIPPPSDSGAAGPLTPYRIVCRFHVIRRSDGSGGIDESVIGPMMRDLNYGFRDTPFYYVREPGVTYIDNDEYYEDFPDFLSQIPLVNEGYADGVLSWYLVPLIQGGGAPAGAWVGPPFTSGLRGILMAYANTGTPSNIVTPTHEAGHIFGLAHPYETVFGPECTSGTNCSFAGDKLCDTPASPTVHGGNTTATGIYFEGELGPCQNDPPYDPLTDLYMEAGWPAGHILRDQFTQGQKDFMDEFLFDFQSDLIFQAPAVLVDCDGNDLDDAEEILAGEKPDINQDLVPDGCQIFARPGDLLVSGMTPHIRNRVRIFDRDTGDYRETLWNGMTWVHQLREGPDGLVYLARLTIVQRIDLATGRTVDNFLDGVLDGSMLLVDLLFEPDGNILVLDNNVADIKRFDGRTGVFLGVFADLTAFMSSPKYMEWGPEGDIFVVGNGSASSGILRVDGQSGNLEGSFITPGDGGLSGGQGLVFHDDGYLYVSNAGDNNVLRYDGQNGAFVDEFVSPGSGGLSNPHSLRFGPDGRLYVASRGDDSVKVFDGATGAPLGNFVEPAVDELDDPAGLYFVPVLPGDADRDGEVGIGDFLLVLGGWGACAAPCPPHCAADVDGDCEVGIGDFLTVLGNWSP